MPFRQHTTSPADLSEVVDPFTQAFMEIDEDGDGVISMADLENFVRKTNLGDGAMVKSWMRLFDVANGQLITLKAYREKLGLPEDGGYNPRLTSESSLTTTTTPTDGNQQQKTMESHQKDPETRVISASMPTERQNEIIRYVKQLRRDGQLSETQLVSELKRWLEDSFGEAWHVLAIKGSYWMHYSHEVDCSFQFHLGSNVYLMWRTPSG